MELSELIIKNHWLANQNTSWSITKSLMVPPPNPVVMPMIKTPNKSNFLHPARKTPDAEDTATAVMVSQYREDNKSDVISKIIIYYSMKSIF